MLACIAKRCAAATSSRVIMSPQRQADTLAGGTVTVRLEHPVAVPAPILVDPDDRSILRAAFLERGTNGARGDRVVGGAAGDQCYENEVPHFGAPVSCPSRLKMRRHPAQLTCLNHC